MEIHERRRERPAAGESQERAGGPATITTATMLRRLRVGGRWARNVTVAAGGAAPSRLAVVMGGVGDVRRGGEGPDRAAS
jgi:hypothetical protein